MSLGQNIYRLRMEKDMSQGDLAEALEVSRQSISKWETDSSVPELEKLLKLSRLFGVTLDELVSGDIPEAQHVEEASPQTEVKYVYVKQERSRQKIAGIVLLCMGFLVALLLTLFGSFLGGLTLASPFVLCGILCVICRRNAGLWCGWALFILVALYMRFATSIQWTLVYNPYFYQNAELTLHLLLAYVLFIALVALVILTALRLGRQLGAPKSLSRTLIAALALLAGFILSCVLYRYCLLWLQDLLIESAVNGGFVLSNWSNLISGILDCLRIAFFTALLTLGVRCVKRRPKG